MKRIHRKGRMRARRGDIRENATVDNPWIRLPTEHPEHAYVLPEDLKAVMDWNQQFGRTHEFFLHTDKILPEPFVGAADAPVVLLSNNPGYSEAEEKSQARQIASFRERMRKNLRHEPADYPFVFLDPDVTPNDNGNGWWQQRLRPLIERFGVQAVSRSVLNVVYFPYPSRRYGHRTLDLPSRAQQYGFGLVRNAVARGAVVLLLRSGEGNRQAWLEAVPELEGKLVFGKNPQAPYVSPGNCPDCFETIVAAIAAFTKIQPASV